MFFQREITSKHCTTQDQRGTKADVVVHLEREEKDFNSYISLVTTTSRGGEMIVIEEDEVAFSYNKECDRVRSMEPDFPPQA